MKLFNIFRKDPITQKEEVADTLSEMLLTENGDEKFRSELETVGDESAETRLHQEAIHQIRSAAEQSVKRLHVLQKGRCPQCGEVLQQHMFVSVCDSCGWNSYSMPKVGGIRLHTRHTGEVVEGTRCHVVKDGAVLVLKGETVVARVPAQAVEWIEYIWKDGEIEERRKQILERLSIPCGWCGKITNPESDGFHLVHAAFGASQERFCFCCDDCYEAFRQMYPSRVHRNCYERSCDECNLCSKRYFDESEGYRTLAKDYISSKHK